MTEEGRVRSRFCSCWAIKPPTLVIQDLHDRNPIEIVLADQFTPILNQEGVSRKQSIPSEGSNAPPEPRRWRQDRNLRKFLIQSRGRTAEHRNDVPSWLMAHRPIFTRCRILLTFLIIRKAPTSILPPPLPNQIETVPKLPAVLVAK
jgi:hypothetical protein